MSEINDFVDHLLKTPPGEPNSVGFEIDTEDNDVQALFEVMLVIMIEILKKWYPPPITIALIPQEDLVRLTKYYASFGIRFDMKIEDLEDNEDPKINNREYLEKSRLEDMRFRHAHDGKLYSVRFSSLPIR
jgi:hypothetical protein